MRIELLNGGGWADTGCWIDGHWGQYGPDRLISIAVTQGWELEGDDAALAAARAHLRPAPVGSSGAVGAGGEGEGESDVGERTSGGSGNPPRRLCDP